MLGICSKRLLMRLLVKSLLLILGLHYSWLFYYIYVSVNAHKEHLPRTELYHLPTSELHSNRTFQKNRTMSEVHSLSSWTVPHCGTSVFVLIVVLSAPMNFDRRFIIRNTWAKIFENDRDITSILINGSYTAESLVKTVFLLGQTDEKTQNVIESESQHYNDIVIGSFTDSYGNLTLKAKLGLEWAQQFCKFEYYLKTDDDVYVYSKGVVQWLWQLPRARVYTGRCDFDKKVIRTAGHKWGVSKEDYQRDTFPPYCVGMGYVLSSDVLQNITSIVRTQPLFKLEDVYVGLILEKIHLVPVDRRKYFQVHSDYSWDVCKHKNLLLGLDATPKQMVQLHLKFSKLWKCGKVDYFKRYL